MTRSCFCGSGDPRSIPDHKDPIATVWEKFDAGSASSGPGVMGIRDATGTDLELGAPDGDTNLLAI